MSDRNHFNPDRGALSEGSNMTMGRILAVAAFLIVAAFMYYNSGGHGPARAADKMLPVTQTATSTGAGRTAQPVALKQ
jgi:hypothetical protein